ncbi:hypothetical protein EZ428_22895 [Pedobacter frigiditerrae]|uniref:Lipoprotein n=1 Tax=Pedobacter frigiditerrae TaxID=2530452 RepID=A0A4R0MKC6_9SPHI|nr:hypothetical protein [Pedobacter frigiditerrae]TCC87049.1 hypothetical protein EZ428_22895 [Pedobacter frigiditerrae]
MKKKILGIALMSLIFIGCEKPIIGKVISADVNFLFINSKGEDLLSINTTGALTEENVDIYVLRNGSKIRLYQGNLDAYKFFKIRTENGKSRFQLYFDISPENFSGNRITQFIRYKDGTEDEIVGEFNSDRKRNTILQQIWINGIAKSRVETGNSGQNPIVIVKQ